MKTSGCSPKNRLQSLEEVRMIKTTSSIHMPSVSNITTTPQEIAEKKNEPPEGKESDGRVWRDDPPLKMTRAQGQQNMSKTEIELFCRR